MGAENRLYGMNISLICKIYNKVNILRVNKISNSLLHFFTCSQLLSNINVCVYT